MRITQSTDLTSEQKKELFELWNFECPEKLCYSEISEFENYLEKLSNKKHYLLLDGENQISGWAFTFVRENEKWFAIIISYKVYRKGYGSLLLNELKKKNLVLNGWVIDHQNGIKQNKELYISPLEFYKKNGFSVYKNIRLENEKISALKISWKKE